MRIVTIGLLVAVSVAACGPSGGRLFQTALPTTDHYPLPVELRDGTGLVTGIEPAESEPQAAREPRVEADPTNPSAFIVSWLGGMCEGDAMLSFWRTDSTYTLFLAIRLAGTGCTALGVARALRVRTSSPISADSIRVSSRN